jgi:hypothetical protein
MARLINLNLKGGLNVITQGNPESKWPHVLKTASSNSAPVIDLDFSKTPQIDSRLTFTRDTTGTIMAYAPTAVAGDLPIVTTCAVNEARFQNARRVSQGVWSNVLNDGSAIPLPITLLAEEARTNLFTQSETFSTWTKYASTTQAGAIVSPSGGAVISVLENNTSDEHAIYLAPTLVNGTIYTASAYFKYYNRQYVSIWTSNSGTATGAWFDIQNGVVGTVQSGLTASIKDAGNGWYRCFVSYTATGNYVEFHSASANGVKSYLGDITKGFYIWGAQLEAAPNASSYIPTTTVAVPRAADVASFTGAGLSWYNAQQGTFAITASGSAFKAPSDFGALSLTYANATKYLLGYNNSIKNGSTYLYTAATVSNPTEYTGVAVPTTIYVNSAGIANISKFTYYPKALKANKLAALL